jgi:hypothetical protein
MKIRKMQKRIGEEHPGGGIHRLGHETGVRIGRYTKPGTEVLILIIPILSTGKTFVAPHSSISEI